MADDLNKIKQMQKAMKEFIDGTRRAGKEIKDLTGMLQDISKKDMFDKSSKQLAAMIGSSNKVLQNQKNYFGINKKMIGQAKDRAKYGKIIGNMMSKQSVMSKIRFNLAKTSFGLQQKLGISKDKELAATFKVAAEEGKQVGIEQKMTDLAKKAGSALKNQILSYLSITAIFAGLWKIATGFAGKIDEVGKTFGVMASDDSFVKGLTSAEESAIKLGFGLEDVVSTVQTLSSEFGVSLGEAAELSTTILNTAKATGMSAGEATNLFGVLKSVAGLSNEQAESLTESTFQLAKQKGVAPGAVLKDIAASSETIAQFTGISGENIAEAATQARQLGVSLDTTAKVARGLLDFESSLNAEMEASIMVGKQLNFQKARELALNNDISGAMKEVISQLGSEEEFNRMNVLQRESLAKSIGVSTAELAKFVKGTKDLSISGALASGSFKKLIGPDAVSGISNLTTKFKSFMAQVVNVLGPTFDGVAKIMSNWLGDGNTMTEELENKFKSFGTKVEEFFVEIFKPAGEGTLSLWDSIGETMNKIPDFLKSMGNTIKWLIPIMITMKGISMSIALAEAAKMVFSMGAKSFGVGAVVGAGIAASVWGGLKALSSFKDLPTGAGADLQGATLVHSQGSFGKETVLHTEEITNEIKLLRQEMKSYLGFGGTAVKGIGRSVVGGIESVT